MDEIINTINFDLTQFPINDLEIIFFFFKAFSVVFTFLFLLYSIILARQTAVLRDTLSTPNNGVIVFISQVQLIISVVLLLYALFLL